jgi:hypothetical protein
LLFAAKAAAGVSVAGAGTFHLVTRKCHFEPFGPENGKSLFQHPLLKQTNPWNKPVSYDSCVREVPFEKLDPTLIQDARNGGTQLIEKFIAGMWGGFGKNSIDSYVVFLLIMTRLCHTTEDHGLL